MNTPDFNKKSGFTLVELLVVMAVMGLLAGMVFMLAGLGSDKNKEAKVQVRVLGEAIRNFKQDSESYDYPYINASSNEISANQELLQILLVKYDQDATNAQVEPSKNMKAYISPNAFYFRTLTDDLNENPDPDDFRTYLVDAWGNPYIYCYKKNARDESWKSEDFILISAGADGEHVEVGECYSNGVLTEEYFKKQKNMDNVIYK